MPGIFPSEFGYMEINTQLLWKSEGSTFVPAGTPIGYLVLVEDIEHESIIREITNDEKTNYMKQILIKQTSWEKNYSEYKDFISNIKQD